MAPRSFEAVCFRDWHSRSWGNADFADAADMRGLLLAPTTLLYRSKEQLFFLCEERFRRPETPA